LVNKNADKHAINQNGQTPLDLAKKFKLEEFISLLKKHGAT
jgi:ankyrin repeat protein